MFKHRTMSSHPTMRSVVTHFVHRGDLAEEERFRAIGRVALTAREALSLVADDEELARLAEQAADQLRAAREESLLPTRATQMADAHAALEQLGRALNDRVFSS